MEELAEALGRIVGCEHVDRGDSIREDDLHDEALTTVPVRPLAVVRPGTTVEVSRILELCHDHRVPVVARGSGTGLSGAATPPVGGILVVFDRMDRIVEVDRANQVAVVEPGVTLARLDETLAPMGLIYPVSPGEMGASIGGNVATNAGGMRAVRYGVTRHHVLGLEVVLPGGTVMRTGGRYVKSSSGYDLTQLLVGSEGTLALVTEATLKLETRPPFAVTVLAPFAELARLGRAVPTIVGSGVAPVILEYIDVLTMDSITAAVGLDLGVAGPVRAGTRAYLVVVLEGTSQERLDEDVQALGELLEGLGALDVYVLPPQAGGQLITARERAFFVAKAAGADDIVDTVVPRAEIPTFLARAAELAAADGALLTGCGHVGDGNVHLSVFQPDPERRHRLLRGLFAAAMELGGAISGEHGLGTAKRPYFEEMEDPKKLALMVQIRSVFDPRGILSPDTVPTSGPGSSPEGHDTPAGRAGLS